MAYSIREGNQAQWDEVAMGLIRFNQHRMGVSLVPPEKFTRVAFEENGEVLGCILCTYYNVMDNLYIDIFQTA